MEITSSFPLRLMTTVFADLLSTTKGPSYGGSKDDREAPRRMQTWLQCSRISFM